MQSNAARSGRGLSGGEGFEKRGVSLALLTAVRDEALGRNPYKAHWSIGRVSAELVGNHELTKPDCRWGQINLEETLTFHTQCSLIDTIRQQPDGMFLGGKHVRYQDVVSVKANVFVSFTYGNNFIELVDALERYVEKHHPEEGSGEIVYFWFDMFVNDQWHALDRDFDWWATTFRTAVQNIGETVIFLSPWEDPIMLKRAWCLYEISCSKQLSVAISKEEEISFVRTLRSASDFIVASLSRIDLRKATAFLDQDKQQIFEVVGKSESGFEGFNKCIVALIRQWVGERAKSLIAVNLDLTENDFDDLERVANLLSDQGNYDEAKPMYERALAGRERVLGEGHPHVLLMQSSCCRSW